MICHEAQASLPTYVQNELQPGERKLVEQHLADCAACRTEHAEVAELLQMCSAVGAFETPPHVWDNINAAITAEPAVAAPVPVALGRPSRGILFGAIAACLVGVVAFGFSINYLLQPAPVTSVAALQAGAARLVSATGDTTDLTAASDTRFALWPGDALITRDSRARVALGGKTELVLGRDTEVRMDRGRIHLKRGRLLLDESGGQRWQLLTDRVALRLVGTQVELALDGTDVNIRVLEGRVIVEAAGARRDLSGGEGLSVAGAATLDGATMPVNKQLVLGEWRIERLTGELTVDRAEDRLTAVLRLTNRSGLPTELHAAGTSLKCWLQVTRDGKRYQIPIDLDRAADQDVVLGALQSHTYRIDVTSHFTRPGTYRLQARYLVGRTAQSGESPSHTVETPTTTLQIR